METLTIGKIVNTHGIKGELKVVPSTDDSSRFNELDNVYVEKRGELHKYDIETVRFHKNFVLIKFKDINSIEEGEIFKNCLLKIDKQDALPLGEDEYYIGDLYGLIVKTEEGRQLGVLDDVLFSDANDVYVIKRVAARPLLIPAIKDCILNVDIEQGLMIVKLLEGLEDIEISGKRS
ncbi:MAG: 16S rRNA processing protein RimM [Candidatus Epulonipiscioides saccharophilum]|nr:MAG: 16S rRNA processing protein RimM [Epulopiscium sp. AS2M-Bin001]